MATKSDLSPQALASLQTLTCKADGSTPHEVRDAAGLEALTGLRVLDLANYTFPVVDDGNPGTEKTSINLPDWGELTNLTLRGAAGLPHKFGWPKLTNLSLLDGTFATVPPLDHLPALRVVDVSGSHLTAQALTGLASGAVVVGSSTSASQTQVSTQQAAAGGPVTGAGQQSSSAVGVSPASVPLAGAASPQDGDVMPDGPLKNCVTAGWDFTTKPATYANTKTITAATISPSCVGTTPTGTMTNWTGANFLPGLTSLAASGFSTLTLPAEGLGTLFQQLGSLDLSRNRLSDVSPLGVLPKLTDLNLSNNWLQTPPSLAGFTELKQLNLSTNWLAAPPDVSSLPKLTDLNLSNNWLADQPDLSKLPDLVTLNLSGNALTQITGLDNAPSLTALNLGSNQLTAVTGLDKLTKLVTLDLSANQLAAIPALTAMSSLTTLNLGSNQLTAVTGLDKLTKLVTLDLSGNQLTSSPALAGLTELVTLKLTANKLATVSGLSGLPKLVTLDLSSNQLATLPALSDLPELTTLELGGNKLTTLPSLAGLPKLTTINAPNNQLVQFPVMGTLPTLQTLNLSNNMLATVSSLDGLTGLLTLNLSNNKLTTLPSLAGSPQLATVNASNNVLAGTLTLAAHAELTTLSLNNNQLTKVDPLPNLPKLTTLDVSKNQLTSVGDLSAAPELTGLTITDNKLTNIDGIGRLPKLTVLSLSNNALAAVPAALDMPQLTGLYIENNAIDKLTFPASAGVPKLTQFSVKNNKIRDISVMAAAPVGVKVNAVNQIVTYPDIVAAQAQRLSALLAVPSSFPAVPWTTAASNMPAINTSTDSFVAARAGKWSLNWYLSAGAITYGGTIAGQAVGTGAIDVSFVTPQLVREGDNAVYQANVSGIGGPDVAYQWYRGTVAVAGATQPTFTIPAVTRGDDGAYVNLVVSTSIGIFQTTQTRLSIQPALVDPNFEACVRQILGDGYSMTSMMGLSELDCSNRGITSLVDISLIGSSASVNLSGNLITDISPLYSATNWVGLTRTGMTDLSDNLISDVTPLGHPNVWFLFAKMINLDGNRISDISALNNVLGGPSSTDTAVSIGRQRVGVPGVSVGADVTLPVAVTMAGDVAPLMLDGMGLSGPTVKFLTSGVKELAWDVPVTNATKGVSFSGAFLVPVGVGTSVSVTPENPVGGHPVSLRATGFPSNDLLTVKWEDGTVLFAGRVDSSGMLNWSFIAPYIDAKKTITVEGTGGTRSSFQFRVTNDEVVSLPDKGLRTCVNSALHLPADSVTYRTRINKLLSLNGSALPFVCHGQGVADLTGLDQLPVSSIDLSGNLVTSLDSLSTLNPLTTSLNLRDNQIDRLGTLAPQPQLTSLDVSGNHLMDFTGLDTIGLAAGASIAAYGQSVDYPLQLVGLPGAKPVVPLPGGATADVFYPDGISPAGATVTWPQAGQFTVYFTYVQAADPAAQPPTPALRISGAIQVVVVDQGAPKVVVNPQKVYPTMRVNILATGLHPGERAIVVLNSQTLLLGVPTADQLGMIRLSDVVIPRNLAPGAHTLRVEGLSSGIQATTTLTVLAYPADVIVGDAPPLSLNSAPPTGSAGPAVPQAGTPGGRLPRTGVDNGSGLVVMSLMLLFGVCGALRRGRRNGEAVQ